MAQVHDVGFEAALGQRLAAAVHAPRQSGNRPVEI
jgi:hypothetical protein